MRAGSRFRMILDAEDTQTHMAQTFNRVVIEIDVGDFRAGQIAIRRDREPMIMAADFHHTGQQILDRLVAAAMSEAHLFSLATEREADDLMSEADAENGQLAE